jgi:hypothetical protein
MEAAGVDSVWLDDAEPAIDTLMGLAAMAAVTASVRLGILNPGQGNNARIETLSKLSRGRIVPSTERWQRVETPQDRSAWSAAINQADQSVHGILVPLSDRLLDILRHPDELIDRQDVLLAQG